MVERLVAALRLLAAPAPAQLAAWPHFAGGAGELVPEFADAWLLARQCPGLEFTAEQRALLDEIDRTLEHMGGGAQAHLWTPTAPAESAEWSVMRELARQALVVLGRGIEPPEPYDATSLPGLSHPRPITNGGAG